MLTLAVRWLEYVKRWRLVRPARLAFAYQLDELELGAAALAIDTHQHKIWVAVFAEVLVKVAT